MGSIHGRVLIALLVAGFVPVAVMFAVTQTLTGRTILIAEQTKLFDLGEQVASGVADFLEDATANLEQLASNTIILNPALPEPAKEHEFQRVVDNYDEFIDIALYDSYGFLVFSSSDQTRGSRDLSRWFTMAMNGERFVSRPEVDDPQSGRSFGIFSEIYLPVKGADGRPHAVIKARVGFKEIWELIDERNDSGAGQCVLVDDFGNILAHPDRSKIFGKFDDEFGDGDWESPLGMRYLDADGKTHIVASNAVISAAVPSGSTWTLLYQLPLHQARALLSSITSHQVLAAVMTLFVAVGIGVFLSTRLARPVVNVAHIAKRVTAGNLDERVPEEGAREMQELATSFNAMVDEVRNHRTELESLVDSRTHKLRDSQRQLENLNAELRASYEAAQEGIMVVGEDGRVIAANQRVAEFFGVDRDVESMAFDGVRDHIQRCFAEPGELDAFWTEFDADGDRIVEDEWRLASPQERSLAVYSAPVTNPRGRQIARLWSFGDITEQRNLQRSLEQAQKMEAIGRLAGGVAHDFNNLLTGIIGNLSLVGMDEEAASSSERDLGLIESAKRAGERAAELVKKLLGFSRQSNLDLRYCDVNEVIADVKALMSSTIDRRITILTECAEELWTVRVDATQVEQVVMNMCVNAKDAMEADAGTITLRTGNCSITSADVAARHPQGKPGDYVVITVADDGSGMPPEVLAKIFEPFFTTKEQGKGTGLGLATSYGIVQQHGGWIECDSEVGGGTKFSILLPREERPAEARPERNSPVKVEGGDETLLLVDDEEVVRSVAEGILRHHGYQILTASDGIEALEVFEANHDRISLVLLDLTMPRLSGKDTLAALRDKWGDVPVVVCSGYMVDLEGFEEETGHRPDAAVQKPYSVKELARQIREILDAAARPLEA